MFASTACGFAFDLIIARRPDSLYVNTILLIYLCISAIIIVHLHTPARRAGEKRKSQTLTFLLTLTFCFGGLAGNLLILYGKSGTPAGNVLFLFLLLAIFIGNEFVRDHYEQFRFNIGAWYLLLLTYCIIAVPTFILHEISARDFIISGAISLAITAIFLLSVSLITHLFSGVDGRRLLFHASSIVAGIFIIFNALYFTGVIPPVPLALKQVGMYHSVTRTGSDYIGTYEPTPGWEFWRTDSATLHVVVGQPIYCFSAIFAPTDLATPIVHHFELFSTSTQTWSMVSTASFPIEGGREDGYRGYSIIRSPQTGKWRCDIETNTGNLIGRISFSVIQTTTTPELMKKTL